MGKDNVHLTGMMGTNYLVLNIQLINNNIICSQKLNIKKVAEKNIFLSTHLSDPPQSIYPFINLLIYLIYPYTHLFIYLSI